jgi:uncharacterized protein (TIGR02421 family)
MNAPDPQPRELDAIEDLPAWFDQLASAVCARIAANQRVRRTLPVKGRLKIDRQLPFLCVYRRPPEQPDTGTQDLITGEAAYLYVCGHPAMQRPVENLCRRIVATLGEHFGTFLLLELWSLECPEQPDAGGVPCLTCEPHVTDRDLIPATVDALTQSLQQITIMGQSAQVNVRCTPEIGPPGLAPLQIPDTHPGSRGLVRMGLGVGAVFRDPQSGAFYPVVLRELRQQLSMAIRKAVAAFTGDVHRDGTTPLTKRQRLPTDYQSLGQSAFVRATSLVDQQLGEISEAFDFFLQVTPVNTDQAWKDFQHSRFRAAPELYYRPLPYFPHVMKRRLFEIPIEQIEDATLSELFWEKQTELDRQLTALQDLDTPHFKYTSLQLYGGCDPELVSLATQLLENLPTADAKSGGARETVGAEKLAQFARKEIERYHQQHPEFSAKVEISDSIAAGVMVVQNRLLVSQAARVPLSHVEALLHHEVGTHVLTYFNGQLQVLHQMYAGLAGYEELQEGLAVFAEYLGGGLTANRMRTLACRVLAANCMLAGESFADTFHHLHHDHRLPPRSAFTTTVRIYRGGGYTKDIIYLRGLRELLQYLRAGHEMEPLYVGKLALSHVPAIQELRRRNVLQPPAVLPRFLKGARAHQRIEHCRTLDVIDLIKELL